MEAYLLVVYKEYREVFWELNKRVTIDIELLSKSLGSTKSGRNWHALLEKDLSRVES